MKIASGIVEKPNFQIAHGGAGPQDPKERDAQRANIAISEILTMPIAQEEMNFSTPLQVRWLKMSQSEKLGFIVTRRLESHPLFNSGFGASLQADGQVRVTASYMESKHQKLSAIVNALDTIHAIDLACILQDHDHSILDSLGAKNLMRSSNIAAQTPVTKERFAKWIDHQRRQLSVGASYGSFSTIGCLTCDSDYQLSAMTSTGGVGNEPPGRIGDSPSVAGNYCTDRIAVSCTGLGEQIVADALSPHIALYLNESASLESRVKEVFSRALEKNRRYAAIAIRLRSDHRIEWVAASVNCTLCFGLKSEGSVSEVQLPL